MIARIYTPTTDGTCAACGRPQGEHSRSAWGAVCMPETVTADNLTDDQIRDLLMAGDISDYDAALALGVHLSDEDDESWYSSRMDRQEARARIASAINARNTKT